MTFERTAQAVVNYVQWALSCYGLYLSSQCKKDGNKQEPNKHVDFKSHPATWVGQSCIMHDSVTGLNKLGKLTEL